MSVPDRVVVGALAGAFGVQGEARLKSFCSEAEALFSYGTLYSEDGTRRFDLKLLRPIPGGFAVRVSGVGSREEAEALKGVLLLADRERMPPLTEDEFYHADLIGMEVVDTGGGLLGRVRAVHNYGAGDLLEIAGGADPLLLPFTREVVPTVDLTARRIVADPPGALE
ncbi:MAG: 16S rRNA processing protein RimM [Rhodobacteraceae bacterium]|nr:16S rRNA processing protein RimM [Paracoccaceae bacterium]